MKINIILPAPSGSGGIDVIYKYANNFSKTDDVIVYYPCCPYFLKNKKFISKIFFCIPRTIKNILKYKTKKLNDNLLLKPVLSINDYMIRDADIIIATAWPTAYSVNNLSADKGKKYYFIQDFEIWDDKEKGVNSYLLPLKKIVISKWINVQLEKYLNIGPFPIIYNGLDFDNDNDNECLVDKRNDRNFTFLMLNHKLEKKGVQFGLEVFRKIKEKYPNSILKMFRFM